MAKKYVSLSKLSTFLDNLKNTFAAIGHKHTLSDVSDYKVDTELSSTSTSPVQNKVINAEFDAISDAMGALELAVDGKSDKEHNHEIGDVTNLQTTLDEISARANEGDLFVINVTYSATDGGHIADKTFEEILEAYNNGKTCIAVLNNNILHLVYCRSNVIQFRYTFAENAGVTSYVLTINSTGVNYANVSFNQIQVTQLSKNNTLTTTDKTLVGAINELDSELGSHNHDDTYYTEAEIDAMEFITIDDIDAICV